MSPPELSGAQMLKTDAIRSAKIMLPQIPLNTIYSYADNFFESPELPVNDPSIQKQIDFFRSTKLSNITYSNTDAPDFFTITNQLTGDSIQISNRMSSRGELRGQKLRNLLDEKMLEAPNELTYDTITKAIKGVEHSDMITMLRKDLCESSKYKYGTSMSEEHFNLFIVVLLMKLEERIQINQMGNTEPRDIRNNSKLQEKIWEGIDVDAIYDGTYLLAAQMPMVNISERIPDLNLQQIKENFQKINVYLQQIKENFHDINTYFEQIETIAQKFSAEGYHKAAEAASELYNTLTDQKQSLFEGKITLEEFGNNCDQLIETAQKSELRNHRGVLGEIWHGINIALNALTLGAVKITPTKSIEKIREMKAVIQSFVENKENKSEESENLSPKGRF